MSNTPPPFQPPSWQSSPTSSLRSEPAPPKKSKLPLIIGVVVAVAAVAVVAVLALGGGDSGGSKAVAAEAAHQGLQTVLEDSSFDEEGNDDLRVCPLGDLDDLYDAVAAVIVLDPVVADGVDEKSASEEDGDLPAFVSCQRYVEDESTVDAGPTSVFFQAVLDPPRNYERYITDFSGDSTDVTFDDSVQYKGGEVVMFCAEAADDTGFTGCDADWVDKTNKLAINVFLGGADAKPDDAFTALKAVLTTMADSLASLANTES